MANVKAAAAALKKHPAVLKKVLATSDPEAIRKLLSQVPELKDEQLSDSEITAMKGELD